MFFSQKYKVNVSTDGNAGPYIASPVERVKEVKTILTKYGVAFSLDSKICFGDIVGIQIFNLGRGILPADIDKINNDLNSVN